MIDRVASSIESGVYAMTPDELDRFVVTHTSEISKATPALFIYVPGRERHFGSGVLLQVEATRYLLTAAHVADDCFHRYKRIFFGTPTFDDLLPLAWVRYCWSKIQSDPNRDDDPVDMAVLELTRDVTEKLSTFMRFLTLDDLQLDSDKLKDGVFLVEGYPDFRAETDEMDETIVAQNMPYITDSITLNSFPPRTFALRTTSLWKSFPRTSLAASPMASTWTNAKESAVAAYGVCWTPASRSNPLTGSKSN